MGSRGLAMQGLPSRLGVRTLFPAPQEATVLLVGVTESGLCECGVFGCAHACV